MTDQELIQGAWRLIGGERHGTPFPPELLSSVTLSLAGDRLTTKTRAGSMENRFTLDAAQSPKHIDMQIGDLRGEGIYELEGNRLTILHDEVGQPRPTTLDPAQSSTSTLMLLERVES
jgi:uncharacterized protein (TIGR03067 family)